MSRKITPQTPGEEPEMDIPDEVDGAADVAIQEVDEVDALRAELASCYRAMTAAGVPLPNAKALTDDMLPDADSIDTSTITRPTKTKQGWVLPKAQA